MKKRIINTITIIIISIITLLLGLKTLELIKFECVYKKLFNIYCPGCGTTRMIKAIIRLDLYKAFRYNPLFFILFILLLVYFGINVYRYIINKKLILPSKKVITILVITLISYMLLRNIPLFSFLAPIQN